MWDAFASDHPKLRATARAILAGSELLNKENISAADDDDDEGAEEGRILTTVHRRRERSGTLPIRKKQEVLRKTGVLACEACGFDFVEAYGDHGKGFAECHHSRPVSTLNPGEKTKLRDLHIVCANCHRMIHFGKRWLSISEVKDLRLIAAELGKAHERTS